MSSLLLLQLSMVDKIGMLIRKIDNKIYYTHI